MIRRLLLIVSMLLVPAQALAITGVDRKAVLYDSVFYDEEVYSNCSPTSLLGNDNEEKAFNYFVQKGLTKEQSAGIVGNLSWESAGVNPKSNQHGGGPGRGIAQWEVGGRWDTDKTNVLDFAAKQGRDPYDLGLQLDFLWEELTSVPPWNAALPALKRTSTVAQATISFLDNFEKPRIRHEAERIALAEGIFAKFSGTAVSGGGGSTPTGGCTSLTGDKTQFVDGFTFFYQWDPAWASAPYGSSTIRRSGCGPTSMAMIITNLTGKTVTPVETANYAFSQGLYISGVGSSHSIGPVLAEHWGLRSEPIGLEGRVQKIAEALKKGGLVIAAGGSSSLPWTSGGAYYSNSRAIGIG